VSSLRRRILVADSDEIVVALICHILNRQGYTVDAALTDAEARDRMASQRYDAILLDSNLANAVSDLPKLVARTILLSANNSDSDAPVHAVLQKPIEFALLIETVAACVKEPG
jgi:CheY-like chemotaxis protein